jgi:hypothetical protein
MFGTEGEALKKVFNTVYHSANYGMLLLILRTCGNYGIIYMGLGDSMIT